MSVDVRQEQNTAVVYQWMENYNTDVHRMVDESYADDFAVICPGLLEIRDRAKFHEIEQAVLDAAPDRRFRIEDLIPVGDRVIVEAVLFGTDKDTSNLWETHWCAILTIQDGKVVTDRSYIDHTQWPWVKDQKLED